MKKILVVLLALILVLVMSSCGSGRKNADQEEKTETAEGFGGYDGGSYDSWEKNEAVDMEEFVGEEAEWESYSPTEDVAAVEGYSGSSDAPQIEAKIIRTISATIETLEYEKLESEIGYQAKALGGYIENSEISNYSGGLRYAYFTVRIPAENADAFMDALGENGSFRSRKESSEDVTLDYIDTESHIKMLKAEEDRLIEMMEIAETIDDMMAIEYKLTDVRWELESYQTRLNYYDNQVAYTTISLSLEEVEEITPEEEPGFWEKAQEKFYEAWEDIRLWFEDAAIWLIANGLFLLIKLGAAVLVIWLVIRQIRKMLAKRAVKKADAPAETIEKTMTENVAPAETEEKQNEE